MRFSPSTGSASREAWTSRTKVGTATARTDPTRAKVAASSTGDKLRPRDLERPEPTIIDATSITAGRARASTPCAITGSRAQVAVLGARPRRAVVRALAGPGARPVLG